MGGFRKTEGLAPPTGHHKGAGRAGALRLAGLLALASAIGFATAEARPPAHPDPKLETFYKGLRLPNAPWRGCCDVSDCGPTDATRDPEGRWRIHLVRVEDSWEIHTGENREVVTASAVVVDSAGGWLPVPDEAIVEGVDNEQGKAVACYTYALGILCFLPPPVF